MPGPEGAPVQQWTGATRLEVLVLAQDGHQVPLNPDQRPVQQLSPAASNPPFHDRIHPRRLDRGPDDPGARGLEDGRKSKPSASRRSAGLGCSLQRATRSAALTGSMSCQVSRAAVIARPEQDRQIPRAGDHQRGDSCSGGKNEDDASRCTSALVHVSLNAGADLDQVMWFVGEDGEEPFDRKSGLTSHLLPDRRSVCWLYGHARQDQRSRTASPRARTGA